MRTLRFIISVFVSLTMFFFISQSISVYAAVIGDDYPEDYKAAALDEYADCWNFYVRECTSFAAYRLNSANGVEFHNWYGGIRWGHAKNWPTAAKKLGIRYDTTPAVGSIAVSCKGTYGHVAWVAEAGNGNVTVEEYNWRYSGAYNTRTVSSGSFDGYIHIKDLADASAVPALTDGTYIIAAYYDGMCLGISDNRNSKWGNCELRSNDNTEIQAFNIKKLDSGYYSIQNSKTGLYLDDALSGRTNGTNLQFVEWNGSSAQQFYFRNAGDNYITIICRTNGLLVDVSGGCSDEYTNVQMYQGNSTAAQKWKLIPYKSDTKKPHKHVYDDRITIKKATCTEEGEVFCMCSCGDFTSEKTPAKGHDFSDKKTVDIAVTCTSDGVSSYHCKRCGERTGITNIPCSGHDILNISDGTTSYIVCVDCGYSSKEPVICDYPEYNSGSC